MKLMSKLSGWSSSYLALSLAVGLFALTGANVHAQNQTVSGHLHVTGDTSLSGALNVTGVAELNNNVTNFGANGANAATPGLVLTYTDTVSGTVSTITLATSGTTAIWQWERNSANGLIPQMTLTGTNSIILWNPTLSNSAGIVLNPAGDSTFSGSITATGTNSRLPNQQITTDTASVLTMGIADGMYLKSVGNGASLSNLNATNITAGILSDDRLSNNVGRLNADQTFTGTNVFLSTGAGALPLIIQNDGGASSGPTISLRNSGGFGTGYIDFYTYGNQTIPTLRWAGIDTGGYTGAHVLYVAEGGAGNQPLIERMRVSRSGVSVGNQEDAANLEVHGDANVSGGVFATGEDQQLNSIGTYNSRLTFKATSEPAPLQSVIIKRGGAGPGSFYIQAINGSGWFGDTPFYFDQVSDTATASHIVRFLLGNTGVGGNERMDVGIYGNTVTLGGNILATTFSATSVEIADATLSGKLFVTGSNSQMPNQQITGTASILTKGLADELYMSASTTSSPYLTTTVAASTYLTSAQAASAYIPIGYQTTSTGSYSTALGYNTVAAGAGQLVVGQYNSPLASQGDNSANWISTDALFVIGNGTSDLRSNALVVSKNGDMLIAGSASVGKRLKVTGKAAFSDTVTLPQRGDLSMGDFTNSGLTRAQTVAEAYFNTLATAPSAANISDAEKENITSFLTGLDQLVGLDNVEECWSLRSTQNAGTGTTVYGMLGKRNATVQGSVVWASDGIKVGTAVGGGYVQLLGGAALMENSTVAVFNCYKTHDVHWGGDAAVLAGNPFAFSGRLSGYRWSDGVSIDCRMYGNVTNYWYLGGGVANDFQNFFAGCVSNNTTSNYSMGVLKGTYVITPDTNTQTNPDAYMLIGEGSSTATAYAISSFHMIVTSSLTEAQNAAIYSLYKSTIGQGLGLP